MMGMGGPGGMGMGPLGMGIPGGMGMGGMGMPGGMGMNMGMPGMGGMPMAMGEQLIVIFASVTALMT